MDVANATALPDEGHSFFASEEMSDSHTGRLTRIRQIESGSHHCFSDLDRCLTGRISLLHAKQTITSMKKRLLILLMVVVGPVSFAQSVKEEIDLMQSVFGMEKKAMVASFIKLEGAQADAFWAAYDEYETKRKELGKERIAQLARYADAYTTLDDAGTDQIIRDVISLGSKTDKLIATYYKKIKKAAGVKAAAQFFQFEHYILSKIRAEIMEEIPLIGEFDK